MAARLPKPRPRNDMIAEALTADRAPRAVKPAEPSRPEPRKSPPEEWDNRFAAFLERVMAQAAVGGDPEPLKKELEALLGEAPPGRREELEKNRGKPPAAPAKS